MAILTLPSNKVTYKRVAGTDPAAGVECNDTVPAGLWWVLLSYSVQLVQGATQTPLPTLVVDDGTNILAQAPGSSGTQVVSSTAQYTWAPEFNLTAQIGATPNTLSCGPFPELLLEAGWRIRTVTIGLGANSNYGAPSIYVAELG